MKSGICLIEWGELIKDCLPNEYIEIIIKKDDNNDNKRIFIINTYGKRFNNIISKIII